MLALTLPIGQDDLGDSGPLLVHSYSGAEFFVPAYAKARSMSEASINDRLATFRSDGNAGNIWQYLPNHFKRTAGVQTPSVNLLHEYFHTVQNWLISKRIELVPAWMKEGSAEYFSYRIGADQGLDTAVTPDWLNPPITFGEKKQDIIVKYARRAPETLAQFEDLPATGIPYTAYALGFLAIEQLVLKYGNTKSIHDIYAAITPSKNWKQAFAEVFGVPVEQFYAEFESYRSSL